MLHLSLIDGVGPMLLKNFIERLGQDRLLEIYDFFVSDFVAAGVPEKIAQILVDGLKDQTILTKEIALMEEHNVQILTFLCTEYPKLLKEIHVPPIILYYQGNRQLFAHEKNIACVGSRKADHYAHEVLQHLIVPMFVHDWIVVSGGAQGADTFAHQISLDHQRPTIVVVGSGLCHVYPAQNKKLFEKIVQTGGLIVSSFPMQTAPDPWNFPKRNRLISGLSRGCLVLQAAEKSGALITAECALEQGREVFAVPGSIFDPLSAGCHRLISEGAKLVSSAQDILHEFGYSEMMQTQEKDQQTLFVPAHKTKKIDELSIKILQTAHMPITIDLMLSKFQIDSEILQNKLFELSLDGKIVQDAMGFWKRV